MLSKVRATSYAAAATLVILSGITAVPTVAAAQNLQLAQADRRDGDNRREARRESRKDSARSERRETRRDNVRSDRREARRDNARGDRRSGNRIVVRSHRGNDRWRDARRSYGASTVAFVVLGPRVTYRSYGAGWCRGLHRGRHFDRRVGYHAGRHYGPFRC